MVCADRADRLVTDRACHLAFGRDAASFPTGRWGDVVCIGDVIEGHALRVETLRVAHFEVVGHCPVHEWREGYTPLSGGVCYFTQTFQLSCVRA